MGILTNLLSKLHERQSWCPMCGGEYVHDRGCDLDGLWFDKDNGLNNETHGEDHKNENDEEE